MKLTIITACYNAEDSIRYTIESAVKQSYKDFEYLIIDGESQDNTLSIIKEYEDDRRIHIYSERDYGIYNAMNRGICRAKGDYIYFLNAGDTLLEDDTLSRVATYLLNTNTIYYGSVRCLKVGGIDSISNYSNIKGTATDKFLSGDMPCHQAIFAPKSSLVNHFFKQKYKLRADYQWFYDVVFNGYSVEEIPVIIANYDTLGESSNLSNMELMRKETQQIQKEFFESRNVTIPNTEIPPQTEFYWKKTADKHLKIVRLMDNWIALKQNGDSLMRYFNEHNISSIAIYGLGYLGLRLLKELEGKEIVKYAIDQRKLDLSIPVKITSQEFDIVDAIVVTTVNDYEDVITFIETKINCKIICFDDIMQYCLNSLLYR